MQNMSESEKEIMKIIWNNGNAVYINGLLEAVEAVGYKWERATVRTFVARLIDKGFIIAKKQGKAAEYTAAVSESEYLARQAKSFINTNFQGSVKGFLTSLFGQDAPDGKAINDLEEYWESVKEEANE